MKYLGADLRLVGARIRSAVERFEEVVDSDECLPQGFDDLLEQDFVVSDHVLQRGIQADRAKGLLPLDPFVTDERGRLPELLQGDRKGVGFVSVVHEGSSLVRESAAATADSVDRTLGDMAGRGTSRPRPADLPMPINGDAIARARKAGVS